MHAFICVPIIAGQQVIGVLYVDSGNPLEEFTQEDTAFSAAVANELALNLANIRLQKTLIHNERIAAIGLTVSNLAHNRQENVSEKRMRIPPIVGVPLLSKWLLGPSTLIICPMWNCRR